MTTASDVRDLPPVIRPARRADLLDVFQLEKRCFPQPWPYAAFERHIEAVAFLIAAGPNGIIGYVVGDLTDGFPGSVGHIKDLAVHPDYRRRGVARELLSRALFLLDQEGAVRAELEVRKSNDPARALYRDFGFEPYSERDGYYADGENAILMHRSFR